VPPRKAAAAPLPAFPCTVTVPLSMDSASPHPHCCNLNRSPVAQTTAVIPNASGYSNLAGLQQRDSEIVTCARGSARNSFFSANPCRIAWLISRTLCPAASMFAIPSLPAWASGLNSCPDRSPKRNLFRGTATNCQSRQKQRLERKRILHKTERLVCGHKAAEGTSNSIIMDCKAASRSSPGAICPLEMWPYLGIVFRVEAHATLLINAAKLMVVRDMPVMHDGQVGISVSPEWLE